MADISDEDSLGRVRAYKQQLKAAAKGTPAKTPGGPAPAAGAGPAAGGPAPAAGGGTKAKAKSR